MSRCEFSPEARADLLQIHDHIAQGSPSKALRFIDRLEQQCYRLTEDPHMGRTRPEFGPDLRSFVVPRTSYIIYRPIDNGLQIIHVLQGSRNLRRFFER